jgi:hypothetical protein
MLGITLMANLFPELIVFPKRAVQRAHSTAAQHAVDSITKN